MSSPSLTRGSIYGILEFLVYKRKKALRNSKFFVMRSSDQVGDDTRLGNSRILVIAREHKATEAISKNSRFLLAFRLDKSRPAH